MEIAKELIRPIYLSLASKTDKLPTFKCLDLALKERYHENILVPVFYNDEIIEIPFHLSRNDGKKATNPTYYADEWREELPKPSTTGIIVQVKIKGPVEKINKQ